MTVKFHGLIAPVEVPTGDGRMFAPGKLTHRPTPLPLLVRFSSGGHVGAVPIGKVTRIYDGPGGYWAEGEFLDPEKVPEVAKAIYMLQEKIMGPSVDLDQNFTVEMVAHPKRVNKKAGLFKEYNVIGITLVPMPAFHEVHLSVDSETEQALLASLGIDPTRIRLFDVNSDSWKGWQIAPREYKFDADDAVKRIAYWSGVGSRQPDLGKYASAFLWRDGNQMGDSLAQDSFRLPLADIINNEPYLIYHAVYSAAALLSGGHGGLPNIPDEDKARMVPVINEIYSVLAEAFGDPNLKSPFLERVQQAQASILSPEEDCGCTEVKSFSYTTGNGGGNFTMTFDGGELVELSPESGLEFAGKRNPMEPYGPSDEAHYADPGYQPDGKKRYPLDSEKHCRAAWSYINMPKNAAKYTPEQLSLIKGRIRRALEKYGVEVSEDGTDSGEMALVDLPRADLQSLVAGAGATSLLAPPAEAFADPKLTAPTRLTITEDGRVFGHLARWKVCHVGIGNACVIAPKSKTNYALFKCGSILTDDGSQLDIGKITLGTAHANAQYGVMPTREHYDNTGLAAALVNVGEDRHGIWVSGVLTASMTPEKIVELRASPLSGDWRLVNGSMELIAALAVNNPGFPIYTEQNGRAFSLMGVGLIEEEEEQEPKLDTGVGIEFAFAQDTDDDDDDDDEEDDEDVEVDEDDDDDDEDEDMDVPADDVLDDAAELSLRQQRWDEIQQDLEEYRQERRAARLSRLGDERELLTNRPVA